MHHSRQGDALLVSENSQIVICLGYYIYLGYHIYVLDPIISLDTLYGISGINSRYFGYTRLLRLSLGLSSVSR